MIGLSEFPENTFIERRPIECLKSFGSNVESKRHFQKCFLKNMSQIGKRQFCFGRWELLYHKILLKKVQNTHESAAGGAAHLKVRASSQERYPFLKCAFKEKTNSMALEIFIMLRSLNMRRRLFHGLPVDD